jgi:hypothetical protein
MREMTLPRRLALLLCPLACGSVDADTAGLSTTGGSTTAASDSSGAPTSTGSAGSTGSTGDPTTGGVDPCTASPQALADCVDPAAYTSDLQFIADIRTPGSPHWQAVQDLCADRLTELGYEVQLHKYSTGINVVGRRVGASLPNEIVLVAAHYDHIAACKGADDNATGVAATLEIARMLAKPEFDRTVMIACWDEEELGLKGSEAFVPLIAAAKTDIVVNFNFDAIGFRSSEPNTQEVPQGFDLVFKDVYTALEADQFRGDFIAIITSSLAKSHALAYAAAADRIGLPQYVIALPAGQETSDLFGDLRRSDHASFWDAGYPAVFLTDTAEFRNPDYHCMGGPDEVSDLDLDFAANVTRATVEASAVALGM